MTRQRVKSRTMRLVGYDFRYRVLEIEFNTGRVYHYLHVPSRVCLELLEAPSKGKYFNDYIRDQYPTKEIKPSHRKA